MTITAPVAENPEGGPVLDRDDEVVASTDLSANCDIEVLPVALRVAKNPRKDLRLRSRALRILLKNKSINGHFLRIETVSADLTDIAQEPLNDDDDDWQQFSLKRYAFQCLKIKANDLTDDFYRTYSISLKKQMLRQCNSIDDSGLKKLDEHIEACEKSEKFRVLESLSIALSESNCGLRISMFNDFVPSAWTKESLVYALLSNNSSWDAKQVPHFLEKINDLDDAIRASDTPHTIEDVLTVLIETQNRCRLNIEFINNILTSIGRDTECLDVITRDFCFLPTVIDELATVRLKNMCKRHKITHTTKKNLTELQSLLLYSDKAIASIFEKIKAGTRVDELVKFLRLLKKSDLSVTWKDLFLIDLGPSDKSIDDWKTKLYLQLIENVINREFPNYKKYSYEFGAGTTEETDFDRKYFEPISCTDANKHSMYFQCRETKSTLQRSLNSVKTRGTISKLLRDLQRKISMIVRKRGWSKKCQCLLETLIKCLDSEDKIVQLTNALEILGEYEIDITDPGVCEILSRSNALSVQSNIHKLAIERSFPGTYEKSFDQLIDELAALNENEEIGSMKIKELSMSKYSDVMRAYSSKSALLPYSGAISKWNKGDVHKWVKKLPGHPGKSRENKKDPLSSLINAFLYEDSVEGHPKKSFADEEDPLSTLTGRSLFKDLSESLKKRSQCLEPEEEGSEISQAERIAVIKRTAELISGFKVRDVQLLSVILLLNPTEAKGRLSQINTGEGKTMIISMIAAYHATQGSKVDVITSSPLLAEPQAKNQEPFYSVLGLTVSHNIDNHNEGYEADVVYGTSQAFQGDILRDEFRKSDTRRGRRCDIAIVDEVDNMLVDGNNYIVMLSCEMPAMDHLAGLLATIFIQVNRAAQSIQYQGGQPYFVEKGNAYDEKGEARQDVVNDSWYPLQCSAKDFITECTEKHVRKLIRDKSCPVEDESFPELKIPEHLRNLVCKAQLKKWIEKAIAAALAYVKDVDYILDKGEIKIVDAANTGVVKKNSQWSSGLHQFLQIKHGAKISPESLTTNFISNVNFFQRYPPKLYGLTGTLGTNGTKELLSKTYGVDSVVVPPFKLKRHRELAAIVCDNKEDWYSTVAKSCLQKLNNGRAVLIIMENIKETRELEKVFKDHFRYDITKIKLYKTEKDARVVEEEMKPGHVIITTNIAGRGTDIKVSKEIDTKGGLHVCITFLPRNSRVEIQNIGRTSRTGNRGTSQFVLWSMDQNDVDGLKADRTVKEKEAMDSAEEQIVRVTTRDMIFNRFCKLCETIRGRNRFTEEVEKKAVEERFAIWLEINEENIEKEPREKVLEDFESFVSEIKQDNAKGALIKNPYMYVTIGNKYLKRKNYKEAIKEYTSAIDLDENFAEHARYNRGYAYVAEYGGNVGGKMEYMERAADDFREARRLIDERQNDLNLIQTASDGEVYSQQVRNKLNLYNVQKNAIDIAIGPDVESLDRQIERLNKQRESDKITPEDKKKIDEAIDNMRKDKEVIGVMQKAMKSKNDLEIELKELIKSLPEDDQKTHDGEIEEFERNGCIGQFRISEIPPIDWSAVIGLLLLGLAQLVGGAALMVFTLGAGASFGMGLISEGISDIITAVKDGIINRDFNWVTWAIEKAISITVSVICAGLSAMKDCARTAYSGVKSAASMVTKGLTETTKAGWKIVAKRIGIELAKGIAKEIAKDLINYGIDKTLIPAIEEEIVERIKGPIQLALINNTMVKKMLELDEKVNNDHYYENRIIAMGYEILNPKNNRTLTNIALEVASRVANNKIKGLAVARQIEGAVRALFELNDFVSKFIEKLNSAIDVEARKRKIDEETVETTAKENEQAEMEMENGPRMDDDKDIDLSRAHVEEEQVKLDEREPRSPKAISKVFVSAASANMLNIIKGKIIAPVAQAGVNYGVEYGMDKITSSVEKSIEHETQLHKAHNRIIHNQDKGYNDAKRKKKDADRPGSEDVKRAERAKARVEIERARAGGPAGLVHLGSLSDAADCPIEVRNERGKVMYVIGENKKGTPATVEYHEPKNGEACGHYTLPGGREPTIRGGGSNMCLYNVIAEQKGLEPDALKNSSLKIMSDNIETFAKQTSDIAHLEMYSRMKLASGGAVFNAKNPDETERYVTDSDGKRGFRRAGKAPKGHPGHHIPHKRSTRDHLEATAAEFQTNIEVYNDKGELLYTVGNYEMESGKVPVKFEYHAPDGDKSGERFTSIGGKEDYRLHDPRPPNDPDGMDYWKTLGKMTNKDPDTLKKNITRRMDEKPIPAHPTYERTTRTHFEATAHVLGSNIEVYDTKGKRLYTAGNNKMESGEEPVKFVYRPPQGGKPGEYVSLPTVGKEEQRFFEPPMANSPNEMDGYWKTFGNMTKRDPDTLKSSVTERMDAKMPKVYCVEDASLGDDKREGTKTGYVSLSEASYVTYYAMQHPVVKAAIAKLNEYEKGVKDSDEYIYSEITLSAADLNMPRTAYGAEWRNGEICHVWPATGPIEIKVQHYKGKENDRNAPVHIQTHFPRPPPEDEYLS